MSNRVLGIVDVSRFIQIIGQISRLCCASLEMTTKWIRSIALCLCASAPLHLTKLSSFVIVFMQNKPNLPDAQMDVSSVLTKDYENLPLRRCGENKPNQSQLKPISMPIKANQRENGPHVRQI